MACGMKDSFTYLQLLIHSIQPDRNNVVLEKKQRTILPKETTILLRQWLFANTTQPYPSEEQKVLLSQQTGLSHAQINTWFTDARRRVLQPMMRNKDLLSRHNYPV